MKILAVARTYYMLMVLCQLRSTIYRNDKFDLILTDTVKGSKDIFYRLKGKDFFDSVSYLELTDLAGLKQNNLAKIVSLFRNLKNSNEALARNNIHIRDKYDIFLCYVPNMCEEQIIFNEVRRINSNAKVQLYEEGFLSYLYLDGAFALDRRITRMKIMPILMSILHRKNDIIRNCIDKAWTFDSSLIQYKHLFVAKNIPKLSSDDTELLKELNTIFDYNSHIYEFDRKIMFLEDSFHIGYPFYNDFDLVRQIFEKCRNKDEFMVKLHPRSKEDRFSKMGIHTSIVSMPFELIVLNSVSDNNIFITIASGAPLAALVNFDMKNIVIVLYKLCTGLPSKMFDKTTIEYIDRLKDRFPNQLFVPETEMEFNDLLFKLL